MQPLSICYTGLHGIPMGRQHRPLVAWYGDLDFVPHLKDFIERGAVDAVVTYGEPLPIEYSGDRKDCPARWRAMCAASGLDLARARQPRRWQFRRKDANERAPV